MLAEGPGELPPPRNLEETEKLIQRFYQPGAPQEIARIDRCLKALQTSQQGFWLAGALLKSPDERVRFFGALTFTVKINRTWKDLQPEEAENYLGILLESLVKLAEAGEKPLVVRKLCAALVAVFIQSGGRWAHCVWHVTLSLHEKAPIRPSMILPKSIWPLSVSSLSTHQIQALVSFTTLLVEEVNKASPHGIETHALSTALVSNVPDMAEIVEWGVSKQHALEPTPAVKAASAECIKLLHTLISDLPKESLRATNSEAALQRLLTGTIDLLETEGHFEVVAELLCDALPSDDLFLTPEHHARIFEVLQSPLPVALFQDLARGSSDPGSLRYARLLLAYCEPRANKMASEPEMEPHRTCLEQLAQITGRPGVAVEEDKIIAEVLEFWLLFAGAVASSSHTSVMLQEQANLPGPAGFVKELVRLVVASLLKKIQMPPVEEWRGWDSNTKSEFSCFRVDFMHFLCSVYGSAFGPRLFVSLGEYAVEAGKRDDWGAVEASFTALTGLADAAADSEEIDHPLADFFGSPLFQDIMQPNGRVPVRAASAAARLVFKYNTFFQRRPLFLEPIISFLFRCVNTQTSASAAAKAIKALCTECQNHLAPHAQSFVDQYASYLSSSKARGISLLDARPIKERLVGAVTAVIHGQYSLPGAEFQTKALQAFDCLLRMFEAELSDALRKENPTEAREATQEAINCLCRMGMAWHESANTAPIVLDDDKLDETAVESEEIRELQLRIAHSCSQALQRFPQDDAMMEGVCNVIRAGIPGDEGPFVLPLPYVEELLGEAILATQIPGMALETIARILRKRKASARSDAVQIFALRFLERAVRMVFDIKGNPSNDPEKASALLQFVHTYVEGYMMLLLDQPHFQPREQSFWQFAVTCLASQEIIPRRDACMLWLEIFCLQTDKTPEVLAREAVGTFWGPRVAQISIFGMGGDVPRSELDAFAGPLKKIVGGRREARAWLEAALMDPSFPSKRLSARDKRIFLEGLLRTRGSGKATEAIRGFWVRCRGTFSI